MAQNNVGRIIQIIGAVLDIKFSGDNLPALNNGNEIYNNGN